MRERIPIDTEPENLREYDDVQSGVDGEESVIEKRHRSLLGSITARQSESADTTKWDAATASRQAKEALRQKVEAMRGHSNARAVPLSYSAGASGGGFVPPVDAGMYTDVAGRPGGLFESIQATEGEAISEADIRRSLLQRGEAYEENRRKLEQLQNNDGISAQVLLEGIKSDRYIAIGRNDSYNRVDKSQFPVFRAALGLSEDHSIISEEEDIPLIMRSGVSISTSTSSDRESSEPEQIPDLFNGVGRQYTKDEIQCSETLLDTEEVLEDVAPEELFDMLSQYEAEHERRVEQIQCASQPEIVIDDDPYNTAFNCGGFTQEELDSIPIMPEQKGFVIHTEHHTQSKRRQGAASKRRRSKK